MIFAKEIKKLEEIYSKQELNQHKLDMVFGEIYALKKASKKIEEIDNESEEIPEIIEQNGRKYRLVEE